MNLLYWLKGGFLGVAYATVIIFIKGICPANDRCFADIFMPLVARPLSLLALFLSENQIFWLNKHLMLVTLTFWFIVGTFLGIIYKFFKK
jgi:hypothetical protein